MFLDDLFSNYMEKVIFALNKVLFIRSLTLAQMVKEGLFWHDMGLIVWAFHDANLIIDYME